MPKQIVNLVLHLFKPRHVIVLLGSRFPTALGVVVIISHRCHSNPTEVGGREEGMEEGKEGERKGGRVRPVIQRLMWP